MAISHRVAGGARHLSVRIAKDVRSSNKAILVLFCSCLIIFIRALAGVGYQEGSVIPTPGVNDKSTWAWRRLLHADRGYEWAQSGSTGLNNMVHGLLDRVDQKIHRQQPALDRHEQVARRAGGRNRGVREEGYKAAEEEYRESQLPPTSSDDTYHSSSTEAAHEPLELREEDQEDPPVFVPSTGQDPLRAPPDDEDSRRAMDAGQGLRKGGIKQDK